MLISIDWLQLHYSGVIFRSSKYEWKKLDFETQVFNNIEDVFYNGYYIASVLSAPRSTIIDERTVIIKFINKLLYDVDKWKIIDEFIDSTGLEYKGITRLDVCADFNYFKNGTYPENLISQFMKNNIKKVGQGKGMCHFEQSDRMKYQTLKFGTGKSVVSVYLYNKTKELEQVKMKPYIIDHWKASGLDVTKNVWRLEFSIKGNSLALVDVATGEFGRPNLNNLRDYEYLTKLFFTLQNQYFRFKKISTDKNKSRWPDIELFNSCPTLPIRIFMSETGDSTRADKIFLRKLDNISNELRQYAKGREQFIDELICEFAVNKGLQEYYLRKIDGNVSEKLKWLTDIQADNYKRFGQNLNPIKKDLNLFTAGTELIDLKNKIINPKILPKYDTTENQN